MLRAEARRLERKKQAKAQEVAKNAPRLDHDPVDVEGVKNAPAEPENEKITREAERKRQQEEERAYHAQPAKVWSQVPSFHPPL